MHQKSFLSSFLYLDLRALGLMRIGLGLILIYDLIHRSQELVLHYTDQGVLPVKVLKSGLWERGYWSLHSLSGSTEWQLLLFIAAGIFAFLFLIGYRARIFAFLSWVMLVSLHNHNPLVLNHGDDYLRVILLICTFLPIGMRFSLRSKKIEANDKYFSAASVLFIGQIMFMYFFTALFKDSYEWLTYGDALQYALSLSQMTKPLAGWLLQFPDLLKGMTFGTLFIEAFFPLLLVIPYQNKLFRCIFIVTFAVFHLGIFSTMMIGIFPFVCIVVLIGLLPSNLFKVNKYKKPIADYSWQNYLAGVFLFFFLYLNINSITKIHASKSIPAYIENVLRVDQHWNMFAPKVLKRDGWFIIKGSDKKRNYNLFNKEIPLHYNPENVLVMYQHNARWRKYFEKLYNHNNDELYFALSSSLLGQYEQKQLEQVEIWFVHSNLNKREYAEKLYSLNL